VAGISDDVGSSEDEEATEELTGDEPTGDEPTGEKATAEKVTGEEATAEEVTGEDVTAEEARSTTELLVELGHDVGALVFRETQLAIIRNPRQVRRVLRDLTAGLVAGLAFVTAFAFANVAAMNALRTVMSGWLAALSLCAGWLAIGSAVALALSVRAGRVTRWRWWHAGRTGREGSLPELERARAEAEDAVRETLGRLAPAMTVEIATAVAGDTVGGVVDVGGDLLEASDDVVEELTENLPAGSVVNQMWDVVLMPGRLGVKVATTVLRRGEPREQ
jgi:hypothetical protein